VDAKPLSFILRICPQSGGWRYEVRAVQSEESQSFEHIEDVLHYLESLLTAELEREQE
jgi:hypothetical protein